MGAQDIQKDTLAIAMQQAYYTAYWNNAKHPKTLGKVIKDIYKDTNKPVPDLDVKGFKERKRRFIERGGFSNKDSQL